ncbi:MAG: hypothetical protein ABI561_09995 [Bradyrhizobium sp.]
MADTDTRSLQQIKRETEQTRAGLTDTVEQLKTSVAETASDIRHRISPDAIKAEVSNYIQSRGEQLMNDVTSAARRNPIQAVAVGASIAYPLLKFARAIPFPVLMVGAGLFLAGSKTGQAATQKASDMATDLSDEMGRRAHDLSDEVQDTASSAKNFASDQYDRINSAVATGSSQVKGAANAAGASIASNSEKIRERTVSIGKSLSDQADSLKNDGLRIVSSTAATVQDVATDAAATAQSAASTVADAGMDAVRKITAKASDVSDRAGKTIFQTIEQNPLLVAGVGLLVGGLIASALPGSDFENELVGDTSSAAKRQVQAAASKGFDAANAAVGEIYDETSRRAEVEGLTTEGIGKGAQDITQRVRRVAEAAVTTAFEPSEEIHQPKTRGENDHG